MAKSARNTNGPVPITMIGPALQIILYGSFAALFDSLAGKNV